MASVIKRNKKYRAQVSYFQNGKQNRISRTFETKKEAELWALRIELSKGEGKNLIGQQTLFSEYFEWWIHLVKKNDIKESTFQNYLYALKFIDKLFKGLKLSELNDIVIQNGIDCFAINHSRKTTKELLLKIKTCLRDAYSRGLILNDFTSLIKVRGEDAPKRNRALSISELKKLRAHVLQNTDSNINRMVLVALETGLRRGEILGIKKDDLYEYGIEVKRSISPTSKDTSLKTMNSHRKVSINKNIYEILVNIPANEEGYIFQTDNFKQSSMLKSLLKKLGLPITTFHGLRDTHASFLFSQDIDLVYISKRLGHVNIQTTQNYYLQLMPEKKHEQEDLALKLLDDLS